MEYFHASHALYINMTSQCQPRVASGFQFNSKTKVPSTSACPSSRPSNFTSLSPSRAPSYVPRLWPPSEFGISLVPVCNSKAKLLNINFRCHKYRPRVRRMAPPASTSGRRRPYAIGQTPQHNVRARVDAIPNVTLYPAHRLRSSGPTSTTIPTSNIRDSAANPKLGLSRGEGQTYRLPSRFTCRLPSGVTITPINAHAAAISTPGTVTPATMGI
jgi:hypothetical protein